MIRRPPRSTLFPTRRSSDLQHHGHLVPDGHHHLRADVRASPVERLAKPRTVDRSEEHTSELQSLAYLVCRLLLEKKKNQINELSQQTARLSIVPHVNHQDVQ